MSDTAYNKAFNTDRQIATRFVNRLTQRYVSKGVRMSFEEMSDEEILNIANPIMDNLMDASTEIDHERHTRDFSDRMLNIVTEEYLTKVCEKYQAEKGFFAERKFVAIFKRPDAVAIIWKQYFTKVKGEFVAEVLLIKEGTRYVVDHTMVF